MAIALAVLLAGLSGCSTIRHTAIDQLGDALAAGGTTFAADNDPQLIQSAAPFSLKLMESLLAERPQHRGLLLATASGFTQYAFAFVQQDADDLIEKDFAAGSALRDRARRLYLRGRDHGLRGLDVAHAGFSRGLRTDPRATVRAATAADVPLMYWTAAAWGAAIAQSKDNADLIADLGIVEALIDRSLELDATCLQIMPLMFRNWREVDYVREKIRGDLEARLRAKDCEVLFWADAGWVRFFSKEPAIRPADFKPMKIFVWAGEPNQLGLMRDMGYQPVGLETEQILPGLSTGMIQAVPVPPFLANSLQFNRYAGHMLELNWVPIVGAAVVRRDTWEKIPAELRARLKKSGEEIGERIRMKSREEDDDAIAAMKKRGLIVHDVPPADLTDWRASVEKAYPRIRGTMVPADLFDQVGAHLAEFRSLQAAAR